MPRPPSKGRPGTPVIGSGWAEAHRPAMEATLDATCSIRAPGGTPGTFDPVTLEYTGGSAAAAHFTGACSIEDLAAGEQQLIAGSEQIPTVGYRVVLAVAAAVQTAVGHIVTVGDPGPNGDPTLAGKQLVVASIERGSRVFTRSLLVTENQS